LFRFVPYDETIHRNHFLKLNIEHLNWFVEKAFTTHDIDIAALTGPPSVEDYVKAHLDKFTSIKPPNGIIYIIETDKNVVGMGALKELGEGIGEIKRMYIRPEYRGRGLGKKLLKKLIEKAKEFGYATLRLDTADFMMLLKAFTDLQGLRK
jgi:GNAT superfamily N-acetyltransferase